MKTLRFFLSRRTRPIKRALAFIAIFLLFPGVLIAVSALDNTLFLEGDATGLLEDYLFLSFAFAVAPLLLFSLMFVIRRFKFFLDEIRSHTSLDEKGQLEARAETLKLVTSRGQGRWVLISKVVIGVAALASNIFSITSRTDGWNAFNRPVQFWLTAAYLAILLCFVLNDILVKYLRILWAEICITRNLAKDNRIVVRPLAPDKAGGLRNLGDLSLAFTYFFVPFTIVGLTHYYTWESVTVGSVVGLVAVIPLFLFVFFVPLGVVHRVMADTKRKTLHGICDKYLEVNQVITAKMESGVVYEDIAPHRDMLEMLDGMYQKADKMPVWPFNLKMLSRFLSITLGPLMVVLLESTVKAVVFQILK